MHSSASSKRPRPRLEGQTNPAQAPTQSAYGDATRVVPNGLRSRAAARLLKKGKTNGQ